MKYAWFLLIHFDLVSILKTAYGQKYIVIGITTKNI